MADDKLYAGMTYDDKESLQMLDILCSTNEEDTDDEGVDVLNAVLQLPVKYR